jgi:hypothetical protein
MAPALDPDAAEALDAPLTPAEFARLGWVSARFPLRWTRTPRRRRLLFLGLAAPGFLDVFGTPFHRQFFLLVVGFLLFGAAVLFRIRTEPLFVRADAADLWPAPSCSKPASEDHRHA